MHLKRLHGEQSLALSAWHRALIVFTVLAVVFGSLATWPAEIEAAAYRTTDNVYMRSGPGTTYGVIRTIPAGTTVEVTGSAQNGYLPVTWSGSSGYASAAYLTAGSGGSTPPTQTGPTGIRYVIDGNLNLRSGPASSYGVIAVMPDGAQVSLTGRIANGYSEVVWSGRNGWAASQYLGASGGTSPTPLPTQPPATQPPATRPPVTPLPTSAPASNPAIGDTAIATATVTTVGTSLNMRSGPDSTYSVVRSIPSGATVEIMGAAINGFRPVRYGGSKGWASATYLRIGSSTIPTPTIPLPTAPPTVPLRTPTPTIPVRTPTPTVPAGTGVIGDTVVGRAQVVTGGLSLNMRSGPGATSAVIRSIPNGTIVDVMGAVSNGFLPVRYLGTKGWASQTYLRVTLAPTPTATSVPPTRTPVPPTATATRIPPTPTATRAPATPTPTTVPVTPTQAPPTSTSVPGGPIGDTVVGQAVVAAGGLSLNMRSGPGTTYTTIRTIPNGTTVDVMGVAANGFLPVRYQGVKGWSSAAFLEPTTSPVTVTPTGTPRPMTPTGTAIPTVPPVTPTTTSGTGTPLPSPTATATPIPNVPIPAGTPIAVAVVNTAGTSLMARTGPGTEYPSIRGLPSGVQVDVLGAAVNGWRPVRYAGTMGWVDGRYLTIGATQSPDLPLIDDIADAKVTTTAATSLRSGPATSYTNLVTIPADTRIETLGADYNGWTPVRFYGYKGWVPSSLIRPGWDHVTIEQRITTASQTITTEPGGGAVVRWVTPGNLIDIVGPASGNYVPVVLYRFTGWMDVRTLVPVSEWPDPRPANPEQEKIVAIIYAAADRWGQSRSDMLRVAYCESAFDPAAINRSSGATGLFQFMPSTFAITPNGKAGESIFNAWSNADAAGWMWANGMRHHWECQ